MKPNRPVPPPPDAARLRAAALYYVARYAAHSGRLRRVLLARLTKAALQHPEWARDTAQIQALKNSIAAIVTEFTDKNYINDAAFAANKARVLHRQGKSHRMVVGQLQAEGLSPEQIGNAIEQAHDGADATTLDNAAALRLAQRKHLGPYRRGETDQATVRREYATFARAGFSHAIARTIIQQDVDEE